MIPPDVMKRVREIFLVTDADEYYRRVSEDTLNWVREVAKGGAEKYGDAAFATILMVMKHVATFFCRGMRVTAHLTTPIPAFSVYAEDCPRSAMLCCQFVREVLEPERVFGPPASMPTLGSRVPEDVEVVAFLRDMNACLYDAKCCAALTISAAMLGPRSDGAGPLGYAPNIRHLDPDGRAAYFASLKSWCLEMFDMGTHFKNEDDACKILSILIRRDKIKKGSEPPKKKAKIAL